MADVRPLRALRYASEKISDLAQVITPPYDVISPAAQTKYYERSPYNIIRLELGKEEPSDNTLNNVYTRAGRRWPSGACRVFYSRTRLLAIISISKSLPMADSTLRAPAY